jgi:hypothetical protein
MKSRKLKIVYSVVCVSFLAFILACSLESASSSTVLTRAIDAFLTDDSTVSVTGGSCTKTTRDTSSCEDARTALGLSGDWLKFSCNVVLGLADGSLLSVSSYASATYVTVTATGLPDHKSNFYPTSGSYEFNANDYTVTGDYNDMYTSFSPSFPNPHSIAQQSYVLYIPINPTSSTHANMSLGVVGISVDGIPIYNSLASGSDNIFAEAFSFDECQGHPATGDTYHYHSEPYAVSYQDSNLIGVMRDGFFIYGRYDYGGSTDLDVSNTSSDEYIYGGHVGASPTDGTGSRFHYHATKADGCYHRNIAGTDIKADDGNVTVDGSNPCSGPTPGGTQVTVYMLTGHGNGGTFVSVPTASDNGGTMLNSTVAQRYYYGSAAGACTGC